MPRDSVRKALSPRSMSIVSYLKKTRLNQLFRELGAQSPEILANTVHHFTAMEARRRNRIVINYFGQRGVHRIVNAISEFLLDPPTLLPEAKVLDIGAGTGFFTIKVAMKIHSRLPKVAFYAMDLTPAMLLSLAKRKTEVTPFIGTAENVGGSIKKARNFLKIPRKFDAAFSTLMLHHSPNPEKVFQGLKNVLKSNGKAMILDLCEHTFEEFKTEMADIHMGFDPQAVLSMARANFPVAKVWKMPGIRCESSGRSAEIFAVSVQKRS